MSIVFIPGKQLQQGDLSLVVRGSGGLVYDPPVVTFSILQLLQDQEFVVFGPKSPAEKSAVGQYWVNLSIPTMWSGSFKLVWYLQDESGNESQVYEEFQVIPMETSKTSHEAPSLGMARNPTITESTANLIIYVRELLSDENPDRNYHFRPPTQGKTIAGFSQRVGFIWEDKTIVRMLDLAIMRLCTVNPLVEYHYTLDNIPPNWAKAACIGAAGFCLSKEAARWVADEFSYSLNGVSLDINKAQMYQGLGAEYKQEFDEWAVSIAASKPSSVGLRQSRWLLG